MITEDDDDDYDWEGYLERLRDPKNFDIYPRTDWNGIDGCGLFCLMYIFTAGVILEILFLSFYVRTREIYPFHHA